jgi:site-specific DNA-methyltransferase (adenine-specific)
MEIVYKKTADLIPYYQNPRVISDKAVEECAKSFTDHGIRQVISIDSENVIVAGHTRLLAAKKLGIEEMPCVIYADSPEKINAYRLADNKVAEFTTWENEFLESELENLRQAGLDVAGFTETIDKEIFESFDTTYEGEETESEAGYNAKDLTDQVPLIFYMDKQDRNEVMNMLEKLRDEKNLQTKTNALLVAIRSYK